MCGIAGLAHFDGAPIDTDVLQQMSRCIAHRGPDDEGFVVRTSGRAAIGLANRRLSVIDLAGGHQPIANETRTIWTVLNGELYNFVELRAELEARGHKFVTRSDTEVIVHAYEEFGDACVEHIDGMFALALWDEPRQRLLLARDRFGKKPLNYHAHNGRVAFSSELHSLMAAPGIDRAIDHAALGDYLAFMSIPAPRTIYRSVRKLPPAHRAIIDKDGVRVERYWQLKYTPKVQITETDAIAEVQRLLTAAVRKRLVSEVPVGAYLSGGVDSSAVVAVMARESGRPVETFSIGFDDPTYNELPEARRVADAFNTQHHEHVVRPDVLNILPRLVQHFGEPFADSSAVPSWYLAEMTRRHVTVALNGDGGDEIFAGYGRHLANRMAESWARVPAAMRRPAEWLAALPSDPRSRRSRAARFVAAASLPRADRYRSWAGVFSRELVAEFVGPGGDSGSVVDAEFAAVADLDAVDAMLAVDARLYLPTDLLPKVDITSMAHSLELRSPLLDTALAEFAAALPTSLKLKGGETKYILKRAVDGLIPAQNIRRRKQGFAVPIAGWLRGELRHYVMDHLRPSRLAADGLLHQAAIDRLVDAHVEGRKDYAHHVWTLLMLELWYRMYGTR